MTPSPSLNTLRALAESETGDQSALMATLRLRLRAAGLRITQPRMAILAALVQLEEPASIERIHQRITGFKCDLVTVYRCLATLEELGLVRRCFFLNGTCLYRPTFIGRPSYHLVCRDNDTVNELDEQTSTELAAAIGQVEQILRSNGYTDVSHMLEFFGRSPGSNKRLAKTELKTTST